MRIAVVNAPRYRGRPIVRLTEGAWVSRYDVLPSWECGYLVSALARVDRSAHVVHVDANAEDLSHEELYRRIAAVRPDRLLVKCGLATLESDLRAASRYRRENHRCQLLISSNLLMSIEPQILRDFPEVDGVMRGEMDDYARDLLGSAPLEQIPGIVTRASGAAEQPVRVVQDLDANPMPDWDAYPRLWQRVYRGPAVLNSSGLSVVTSRGCPYRCSYCTVGGNVFGAYNRLRTRSADNIVEELQQLVGRFGLHDVLFCAEPSFIYKQHATALAEAIIRSGLRISYTCCSRPEHVDRELLALLKRSGCRFICYGMESAEPAVLREYGRRHSVAQVRAAVRQTQAHGMWAGVYLLAGGAYDGWRSLARSLIAALAINPEVILYNTIVPFPGTLFYQRAQQAGRLRHEDYARYEPQRHSFWRLHSALRTATLPGWQLAAGDKLARAILYGLARKDVYGFYFRHCAP